MHTCIQIFSAHFQSLKLHKETLNAANIYQFGIIHTKCKYMYRSIHFTVSIYRKFHEDQLKKSTKSRLPRFVFSIGTSLPHPLIMNIKSYY